MPGENNRQLRNTVLSKTGLTKDDSAALKGIAICLLLLHHLFYSNKSRARQEIIYLLLGRNQLGMIAIFAKICVPIFVFVTAYGLATKYATTDELDVSGISSVTARRLKNLMTPFWYVFLIAQLVCNISGVRPYGAIYGSGLKSIIYFIVDALGLASFFSAPTLNDTWWYMSAALLLPLAVPVLCMIERRVGWIALPVLYFISKGMEYRGFTKYLLIALMAITIRDYGVIERIEEKLEGKSILCACVILADLLLLAINCFIINKMCEDDTWLVLVYLCSTLLIVILYVLVIKKISPLRAVLRFTGEHSMSIFLTHTFIYQFFFSDFIYSFRYVPCIWLALYAASMLLAVVLDYTRNRLFKGLLLRRNHD